jgi:hypothetical protein
MATKKIIVVPCIVNIRLKTCGETKLLCACLDANDQRFKTGDHEVGQGVQDIENADPFVIHCGHPLMEGLRPWLCPALEILYGDRIR